MIAGDLALRGDAVPTSHAATRAVDTLRTLTRWYTSRGVLAEQLLRDLEHFVEDGDVLSTLVDHGDPLAVETVSDMYRHYASTLTRWINDPRPHASPPTYLEDAWEWLGSRLTGSQRLPDRDLTIPLATARDRIDTLIADQTRSLAPLRRALPHLHVAVADPTMCAVLLDALPGMPDAPLLPSDPLFDAGLLYLAAPLTWRPRPTAALGIPDGASVDHLGFVWHPDQDGITLHNIVRLSEDHPSQLVPGAPSLTLIRGALRWRYGQTHAQACEALTTSAQEGVAHLLGAVSGIARMAAAFWHLSRQGIVTSAPAPVARGVRRNAARAGICVPEEGVRVVSLRHGQHESGTHPGTDRHYSVRWAVRGHWRNQYYPSIDDRRPVYIHPYFKGPADAPVSGADRVWVGAGRGLSTTG